MDEFDLSFGMPAERLAMFGLAKVLVHVEADPADAYRVARKRLVAELYGRIEGVEGGRVVHYAPGRCEVAFIVEGRPSDHEHGNGITVSVPVSMEEDLTPDPVQHSCNGIDPTPVESCRGCMVERDWARRIGGEDVHGEVPAVLFYDVA